MGIARWFYLYSISLIFHVHVNIISFSSLYTWPHSSFFLVFFSNLCLSQPPFTLNCSWEKMLEISNFLAGDITGCSVIWLCTMSIERAGSDTSQAFIVLPVQSRWACTYHLWHLWLEWLSVRKSVQGCRRLAMMNKSQLQEWSQIQQSNDLRMRWKWNGRLKKRKGQTHHSFSPLLPKQDVDFGKEKEDSNWRMFFTFHKFWNDHHFIVDNIHLPLRFWCQCLQLPCFSIHNNKLLGCFMQNRPNIYFCVRFIYGDGCTPSHSCDPK